MKKLFSTILIACLSIGMLTGISFAADAPKIFINEYESKLDTSSIVKNDRTWVSMSSILTIFGYDVSWDAATKTSTVFDKNTGLKAQFSETTKNVPYTQTGIEKIAVLNEAPFVKDGRTFLQLNVFADIFCKNIAYNEATNTVTLNDAYSNNLFIIEKTVSGPVNIGQNFKIKVSTDGSYRWVVKPNANFAFYGMEAEGVGNYSMYFKTLAHQLNDKIVLQKISSDTGKVLGEEEYSVVVSNQGLDETTVVPTAERITLAEGKENTINVGETFAVNMEQNSASSGFEWSIAVPEGLELISKKELAQKSDMVGSPVTEVWLFKAVKSGNYELKFGYSRLWESKEPTKFMNFKLEVK